MGLDFRKLTSADKKTLSPLLLYPSPKGNPLDLVMETEPAKSDVLPNDRRKWLKGQFKDMGIKLFMHLQQKPDGETMIMLHAYAADMNIWLTYVFSCNEHDLSVLEKLERSVNEEIEVPLQERGGMAVDVLSAIEFCSKQKVLIQLISAQAFLLTRQPGQVTAELANFSQACVVTTVPQGTSQNLGCHGRWPCVMTFHYVCLFSNSY